MDDSSTRPAEQQASSGAVTTTVVTSGDPSNLVPADGILRLRGSSTSQRERRVAWTDEVVDNEGLGRKKTKICCIYHKPRQFGDSSTEDSDSSFSSSSDDDGGPDAPGSSQPKRGAHSHGHDHNHSSTNQCRGGKKRKNAYEKQAEKKKPT